MSTTRPVLHGLAAACRPRAGRRIPAPGSTWKSLRALGPPTTMMMKSSTGNSCLLPTGGFSRWRCDSIHCLKSEGREHDAAGIVEAEVHAPQSQPHRVCWLARRQPAAVRRLRHAASPTGPSAPRGAGSPQAVRNWAWSLPEQGAPPVVLQYWERNTLVVDLTNVAGAGQHAAASRDAARAGPSRIAFRMSPRRFEELEVRGAQRVAGAGGRRHGTVTPCTAELPPGLYHAGYAGTGASAGARPAASDSAPPPLQAQHRSCDPGPHSK